MSALLSPSACRLCDAPLLKAANYAVCSECVRSIYEHAEPARCEICAEPLAMDSLAMAGLARTATSLCAACTVEHPKFIRSVAGGGYEELRPIIHLMKFEGMPSLAAPLASLLATAILSLRPDAPDAMTVVPVPLYRGKRAYNQSTLLAREALKLLQKSHPDWQLSLRVDLLLRTRNTESQYLLSHAQRRDNVHGAFIAQGDLSGRHLLLIDDVYTTGATVAECTLVLLRAGAASVRVATLARAGRDLAVRWIAPPLPITRDGPAPPTPSRLFF